LEQFSDINADCKNEIKELKSPLLKTLKQQLHNFPENEPSFVNVQNGCSKDLKTAFIQKENISNLESFQKEFPLSPFLCSSIHLVSSFKDHLVSRSDLLVSSCSITPSKR
jgi:hypothetical protein